ncbi:MAG: NlpC/P60 family protein [Marmoricola sp.]|nr:NlpC/P60 family protein [Marmoricola sp.]
MRTSTRGAVATIVALAAVAGIAVSAVAAGHTPYPTKSQVDAAKAEVSHKAGSVAAIQARLAAANARLQKAADNADAASEAYNGAVWRLGQAKAATTAAQVAAAAAQAKVDGQRSTIAGLVTETYQSGDELSGVTALIGADDPQTVMDRWGALQSASDSMQAKFDAYTHLADAARTAHAKAAKAQAAQVALTAEAAQRKNAAASAAAGAQNEAHAIAVQRTKLIAQLAADQKISVSLAAARQHALERIAAEKAAALARAKAIAAAKAAAAKAARDKAAQAKGGSSNDDPAPPVGVATTASAARAIAFAEAQVGEPYVWAAAGPGSWDCSGLTMMAWRQGGVSLPHYSAAQYAEIEHIGVQDLRPGDLVFWGGSPSTIHHVAMYLGNGMIIQAPHTGADVDIVGMYSWEAPTFFGRP